ncbi:MAG TPA: lycopene cyclase domain-containing protein, partial [Longimicrobium sp.]|nr:lycopene cyclase domain-containing protein [Longimicrobium sp.]
MSYLAFHAVFILPPLLLLGWTQRKRLQRIHARAGLFLLVMAVVALVYTTPWDNYLVRIGVW